jgi:probable HAF family extracellular repeat protein
MGSDVVHFYSATGPYFTPLYLSADGTTAAGVLADANGTGQVAKWNNGAVEIPASGAAGTTTAHALSANGAVVVGVSQLGLGAPMRAFRWDHGIIQDLGTLGGASSDAQAISADGAVAVGYSSAAADSRTSAFRWQNGQMQDLGTLGGQSSYARAVSADGNAVAGDSNLANGDQHAFLWKNNSMQDLGTLGGNYSQAVATNADGRVVVGNSLLADNGSAHAFRWSAGTMLDLGTLGGHYSVAQFVSADGQVIVGRSILANNLNTRVFRWADGIVSDLGSLGGTAVYAKDMSASGAVVVGNGLNSASESRAFYWSTTHGMQTLEGWLSDNGFPVVNDNAKAVTAAAVSDDGNVVIGRLSNGHNYLARVVTPSPAVPSPTPTPISTPTPAPISTPTPAPISTPAPAPISTPAPAPISTPTPAPISTPAPTPVSTPAPADPARALTALASPDSDTPDVATPVTPAPNVGNQVPTGTPGPGGGLIDINDFMAGVAGVRLQASTLAMKDSDLTLNGLHGNPMRRLLEAGKQQVWASGDFGRNDHDVYHGDAAVGEIGYGIGFTEGVQLSLAIGRTASHQKGGWGSDIKVRGQYFLPEVIAQVADTSVYATISGLYNHGSSDIDRGYMNAGVQSGSDGNASTKSWGGRVRFDWLNALTVGATQFTPYMSHTYLRTDLDHYTETGGGFPVAWQDSKARTNTSRVGVDAVHPVNAQLTLLGRVETAHRYEAGGPSVKGEVLGAGGAAFDLPGIRYNQDWVRMGAGAEVRLGAGTLSFVVNSTTQGEDPDMWGTVGYEQRF